MNPRGRVEVLMELARLLFIGLILEFFAGYCIGAIIGYRVGQNRRE